MYQVVITPVKKLSPSQSPVEIVERKGLGHPDTICDALAEELSLALSRYYRDRFGLVLHHNVDKALLWGGVSNTAFKGGHIIEPMEIFLAGRATCEYKGIRVPLNELIIETSRAWLKVHMHALDPEKHVKLHSMIRPGSSELVDLYLRQEKTGIALANDTSCGVGYAPLDELEQLVMTVERKLNSTDVKLAYPEIGEDIKVMGVRQGETIALTIACALIDKHVADIADYQAKKDNIIELSKNVVQAICNKPVTLSVNTADGKDEDNIYLTVTGTSAEAGDDGEVGRGNRINGLITPYRPMNMEAAAGKNAVTHVGKIYNIVAQKICEKLVNQLPLIEHAQCYLVSRIGSPVQEPQVVDLRLQLTEGAIPNQLDTEIRNIVSEQLTGVPEIQNKLIDGSIKVY